MNEELIKKNTIGRYTNKFENSFKQILYHSKEIEKFVRTKEYQLIEPETSAIRGIVNHQLGHFGFVRSCLK